MDFHSFSLITTLVFVFGAAMVGGMLAKRLKLPTIVGYIAAGIVFGNVGNPWTDHAFLSLIADVGVTLLLFTIGVEFSFQRLRGVLGTVAWAAILQVILIAIVFLFTFVGFGVPFVAALFIAAATSLSSTALVVKVLSERGELDTVSGTVAAAWSIVQDIAVIPIMILLPSLVGVGSRDATLLWVLSSVGMSVVRSVLIVLMVVVVARRVVPVALDRLARLKSREIFLLGVVGIVFLAAVAAYTLGLSAALGAFIAGLLIAETSQNHAIFAEIRPLRDLFVVVFFVTIGMVLPIGVLMGQILPIIGVTLAVFLLKFFVVYGLSRYTGYHRRVAFVAAASLIPMSEFGFIIAREGLQSGALSSQQYVFLTSVTFGTILLGAPVLARGHDIYHWVSKTAGSRWPKIFPEKDIPTASQQYPIHDHVVICGYGRVGKYIGRALEMANIPFVVVEYNQAVVAALKERGIPVVYGDPADRDVLDYAQVDLAKAIVVAIPDRHTQEMIIGHAASLNRRIKIICRSHHEEDSRHLKSLGVTTVIQPEFEAAIAIVSRILGDFSVSADDVSGKVSRLKIEHGLG